MHLSEHLRRQEYPGRFIVIGQSAGKALAIYGVTGRSESSRARVLERRGDGVVVNSTNSSITNTGNPELLTYRAVRPVGADTLIANARHIEKANPKDLSLSLVDETYEPDANMTPRITGAMHFRNGKVEAALQIIRARFDKSTSREEWSVPREEGKGSYIATYDGKDFTPTPSFFGTPVKVELNYRTAAEAAQSAYDALAPREGAKDYRVGVVAVSVDGLGKRDIAIINRNSTSK